MAMERFSKSHRRWLVTLCGILIFPLFLITAIAFIPYWLILQLLSAIGLVRLELPPTLTYIESANRLDLSAPLSQQAMIDEVAREFPAREIERWSDEHTVNIEIYGDPKLCREFAERIENEHPIIEVHYA